MNSKIPTHQMIEAFRAAIDHGGFSAAGEALNMSQPSISRLISDLQKTLGYQLFAKHGRTVRPTAEALALMVKVEESYIGMGDIARFSEQLRKQRMGHLSICAMPAIGHSIMPSAIEYLRARHPDVFVSFSVVPSLDVSKAVRNRQADLGFVAEGMAEGGLEAVAEFEGDCVCIAKGGGFPREWKQVGLEQLAEKPFVSTTASLQRQLNMRLSAQGLALDVIGEVSHSFSASQLVLRGLGISVVDPFTGAVHKASGGAVLPLVPSLPYKIVALAMGDTRLGVAAKDLLQFIRGELKG